MNTGQTARLALYLRACRHHDRDEITSWELGLAARANPTQVRRDLSTVLGRVGKRGVGYRCDQLGETLMRQLAAEGEALAELARFYRVRTAALTEIANVVNHVEPAAAA